MEAVFFFPALTADSRLGWHPRAQRRSTQLLLSNAGVEPTAPDKAWCVRCDPLVERVYRTSAGVLLTRRLDGRGGRRAGGTVHLSRALLDPYSRQSPQRPRTSALLMPSQ